MSFAVFFFLFACTCFPYASGHVIFADPPPRVPGALFSKACGQKATESVKQYQGSGHIEEMGSDFPDPKTCIPTICHGYLFEDQAPTKVTRVTPGQKLDITTLIAFKHNGSATLQIVSTKNAGMPVGAVLASFEDFASTDESQKAHTKFTITFPESSAIPSGTCNTPGDCAVELVWKAPVPPQSVHTYESCFDIVFGGEGQSDQVPTLDNTNNSSTSVPPATLNNTNNPLTTEPLAPVTETNTHNTSHHHHKHHGKKHKDGLNKTSADIVPPETSNGYPTSGSVNRSTIDVSPGASTNTSSSNPGQGKCRAGRKSRRRR